MRLGSSTYSLLMQGSFIALGAALYGFCGNRVASRLGMADDPWCLMGFALAPVLFFIPGLLALRMRLTRLEEEVRELSQNASGQRKTHPL